MNKKINKQISKKITGIITTAIVIVFVFILNGFGIIDIQDNFANSQYVSKRYIL